MRNRYDDQTYNNKCVQFALSHIHVQCRAANQIVPRYQRHWRNDSDDSFQSEGPATDHGSLAPTHEGRDKGAASGRSPNFAGCASKRGAVAAQGPPQLSDAGDLRRNLSVGGRGTLFARGTSVRCQATNAMGSLTAVINASKINEMLKRTVSVCTRITCNVRVCTYMRFGYE